MLNQVCVACEAPMAFVRKMPSVRSDAQIDLFFCEACGTAAMPFEANHSDEVLRAGVGFHERILDRNIAWSQKLWRMLRAYGINPRTVLEIGCGSGATLEVGKRVGVERAIGFDLNPFVLEHAREQFPSVEFRDELWSAATDPQGAEVVMCLSVLEHINDPRPLLSEFAAYCRAADGFLAVSVPILSFELRGHVMAPLAKGSPFRSAEEHVVHFSLAGFRQILKNAGALAIKAHQVGGWNLHLAAFSEEAAERLQSAKPKTPFAPSLNAV